MLEFYTGVLGLRAHGDLAASSDAHWVMLDAGECTLALHSGGKETADETSVKLAFYVEDFDRAYEEIQTKCSGLLGPERRPVPGVRVADGRDPEGNSFSIETY